MMKVLNFGSLNYDYVYSVDHAVVCGETLASEGMEVFLGGKGLNQSIALSRAGVKVFHAGLIGDEGQLFIEKCKECDVDTTYIKSIKGKSGHTIIQVDKNAQNCILLYGGSNQKITEEFVDDVLKDFGKGDILVLQNEINKMDYIIDKAYQIGMTIILNPAPFNSALNKCDLKKVSIFIVNEIEGGQISGKTTPNEMIMEMNKEYPDSKVLLTLGGDGAVFYEKNQTYKQGIYKVKAVDTTAAGDTFTGYFVASLINNVPIKEALDICAKASAITVSRKGATDSIPTIDEVENFK